jgi:hypothetical protein
MIKMNAPANGPSLMPNRTSVAPSMKKLSLVAFLLAIAFTLFATSARAQDICVVNGGRSTVTLNFGLIFTLAKDNIGLAGTDSSQRTLGFINFPITSGAINLDTSAGQILHSGGMIFTSGTTTVTLDSLIVDTLSDSPSVSALVEVNGKFVGRVKLFDFVLPSSLTLPIVPNQGAFYLSGVQLTLDEEAVTALNQAIGYKAFGAGAEFGELQSMVFVPLADPGLGTGPTPPKPW